MFYHSYEYLEVYETYMKNYENKGKIKQPSSSQTIKMSDFLSL